MYVIEEITLGGIVHENKIIDVSWNSNHSVCCDGCAGDGG